MSEVLFVDSGAFLAYFSKKDPCHEKARKVIDKTIAIVITDYVYDEILTLTRRRLGIKPSIEIMEHIKHNKDIEVAVVTEKDKNKAEEIFKKYTDKDFSFTDCTTFAVIERLGLKNVLSFDKHFQQYGIVTL